MRISRGSILLVDGGIRKKPFLSPFNHVLRASSDSPSSFKALMQDQINGLLGYLAIISL
ncbi:hypothetical protein LI328DRAFT_163464 [Trichoderma asperelloides]|nr:hypothetical protein LI328DRAFT_163464 [Trichoderma asperelloides]